MFRKILISFLLLLIPVCVFSQKIIGKETPMWVSEGNHSNYDGVVKFGRNAAVSTATDPETIWTTDGDFVPWGNDSILTVVSTSDLDSAGNSGALTVKIFGVDNAFLRITETITLDGTNNVASIDSFRVIYSAEILTAGTGLTNAGAITFKSPAGTSTALTIRADAGQSETTVFPIASNETGYMHEWHASVLTAAADVTYRLMIFNVSGNVWNEKDILHGRVTGNSSPTRDMSYFPLKIASSSIIQITAVTDTDNADVTGGFGLLLRTE